MRDTMRELWRSATGIWVACYTCLPVPIKDGMSRHAFSELRDAFRIGLPIVGVTVAAGAILAGIALLAIS